MPGDGDTVAGLTGGVDGRGVDGPGCDRLVPASPRRFDDPAEAAWAAPRRTPQPVGCFTEPVRVPRPVEDYPFTRTYIKAARERRSGSAFWAAADRAKASPAWRYHEIETTHVIASNRPEDLTRLLLELS